MSNLLESTFKFDDRDFNKVDALERKLDLVGKKFDQLGGNPRNFGNTIRSSVTEAEKLTNTVGKLERQTLLSEKRAGSLANQFGKLGSAGFQAEATGILRRLQAIDTQLSKKPSDAVFRSITSEAKQLKSELTTLERKLVDVKSRSVSNRGASASGFISDAAGFIVPAAIGASAFTAGKETLTAAREGANAQRLLRATTIETGIAYDKLSASARKFGEDTLQSNRAAQSSFAQIVTFANAAGRADKLDEFRVKFADLAAAKGIDPSNLGDIAKQLNALTDEATDKLLGANPSAFYEKFAASIGKTAGSLSDAEKRAAVFDEVLRRGSLFTGEAEKRVNASASALDRLSVKFENIKEKAGGAAVTIVEFAEFLTKVITADQSLYDPKKTSNTAALSKKAVDDAVQSLRGQDEKLREAFAKPLAGAINGELSKINPADNFFDAAKRQKAIDAAIETGKEISAKFKNAFEANIADKNITVGLARLAQRQFEINQADYDPQTRRSLAEQLENSVKEARKREADTLKAASEKAKSEAEKTKAEFEKSTVKIKELGKSFDEVFANLSSKLNADNPFVQVFAESRSELDKLKESIRGLPADLQNAAIASQQSLNANKLFSATIDNNLSSFDLRETARKFRNGGAEDTRREADYIRLFGQSDFLKGNLGERNLNSAATFLANRRNPDENLSVSDRLQKQLGIINSGVTNDAQRNIADAKILSIAANLDPSQVRQSEREQIAAAAERRAERQERAFDDALKLQAQQTEYQKRIADNGAELLKIAQEKGLDGLNNYLQIEFNDKSGRASITGSSGSQDDVRATYFNEANQ